MSDADLIRDRVREISRLCSAISYGGNVGDSTAGILAALDVIEYATLELERMALERQRAR